MSVTVLHVTRAFSAQPTLSEYLGEADVLEVPLPEALASSGTCPDVVWVSTARPEDVEALHDRFPDARILATPARTASTQDVARLIGRADLVLGDEGVVLAAAGIQALLRRRGAGPGAARAAGPAVGPAVGPAGGATPDGPGLTATLTTRLPADPRVCRRLDHVG